MCQKCVVRSKHLKPKLSFGKIKVYAHRLLSGQPIPVFDYASNVAIEAHVHRIETARKRRVK